MCCWKRIDVWIIAPSAYTDVCTSVRPLTGENENWCKGQMSKVYLKKG